MQKEARYRELIEEQKESGLTIKDFCSNHGIALSTFQYWKTKISLLKEKLHSDFFQCHRSYIINLKHIRIFMHKCKTIKMSNGEEVRVSGNYHKEFLKRIM